MTDDSGPSQSIGSLLIVEDDASTRDAVVAMLEELGHVPGRVAVDGQEAIELLQEAPCDLMMLDLMMPRMDGFEVLRALRTGLAPRPARIIVMSAHASMADREGLSLLGVDKFLSKPFTLDELRRAIEDVGVGEV